MILGIAFNVVLGCPQLVPTGTRTTRHVNKGYACMLQTGENSPYRWSFSCCMFFTWHFMIEKAKSNEVKAKRKLEEVREKQKEVSYYR